MKTDDVCVWEIRGKPLRDGTRLVKTSCGVSIALPRNEVVGTKCICSLPIRIEEQEDE